MDKYEYFPLFSKLLALFEYHILCCIGSSRGSASKSIISDISCNLAIFQLVKPMLNSQAYRSFIILSLDQIKYAVMSSLHLCIPLGTKLSHMKMAS